VDAYRKGDKHVTLYKKELDETLRVEVGGQGTLPG